MSTESHTSPLIRIVDDDDSMRMAPRDYLARLRDPATPGGRSMGDPRLLEAHRFRPAIQSLNANDCLGQLGRSMCRTTSTRLVHATSADLPLGSPDSEAHHDQCNRQQSHRGEQYVVAPSGDQSKHVKSPDLLEVR
jgi:hypothetical protein